MSSFDFRADQIRTNKIIASGSQLLVYPSRSASNLVGGIGYAPTYGSDTFLFVSGSKGSKGVSGSYGTTVFGGDVVVSGSLTTAALTASISVTTTNLPFITGSGITTNYNSQGQWELTSSGGGGLPTATFGNQIPSSDGPGTSYSAVDILAAMRSGIVFATPLTSSTGWTLTPGTGGTVSITPGHSLFLSTPNGSAVSVNEGVYTISWPQGVTGFTFQGRVQLASTDTQAGIHTRVFVTYTHPIDIDQTYYYFEALIDGTCSFNVRGTGGANNFTGPLDGTLWWRMEFSGTSVRCYSGIGSGDTAPTSWTYRATLSLTAWFNTVVGKSVPPKFFITGGYEGGGTTTDSIIATHRMITLSIAL